MYILKNAVKNLIRNKGRNLIVGVLILGIIISTVVGFGIHTTTREIIQDYKSRFGSEVVIVPDMNKSSGNTMFLQRVPAELHMDFATSSYLKDYLFSAQLGVASNNITAIDETESDIPIYGEDGSILEYQNFMMKGSSSEATLHEFKTGRRELIEGEMYSEKNECLISQDLAEKNNIKVGDLIYVKDPFDQTPKIDEPEYYPLKVTGIYFDGTDEYGGAPSHSALLNRRNEILTHLETIQAIAGLEGLYIDATYYLKSPDMLEAFEQELRDKGLSKDFVVKTDVASYNQIVGPVEALGSITIMFLAVVIILGSGILVLLNNLSIRERKYEIGVLRAIGMKKWKVAMGLVTESLVITTISLILGLGMGVMASQPVSDALLSKQIEAKAQDEQVQGGGMIMPQKDSSIQEPIAEIDITFNIQTLLQVVGISLLIVIVSSSVGVIYIMRYEPNRILRERG